MHRTIVYVDGFNLYYRLLKGTPFKWLDLVTLCRNLLSQQNDIRCIKYFTARVSSTPSDPQKANRQDIYFKALQTLNVPVEIILGHFNTNTTRARLVTPIHGRRTAVVYKTEEKGSDVNLAVHLLNDAWHDRYDCGVIVSNDSDLVEPLRLVREHNNKIIGLLATVNPPSNQIRKNVNFFKPIRQGVLQASQLPDHIPGTTIVKPAGW